jgi:serine/threonine protein kinase
MQLCYITALVFMHTAGKGWVHRDISIGNILVPSNKEKSSLKLADLEYAKNLTDNIAHEIRTASTY